jgi:hypothetical protein
VSLFLERIRENYEKHRQPETLKEASGYLRQLTGGKYTRIWTPLAHDILFVDTQEGDSLPVQVLSRGTREQLFVSLRLALVAAFARRGIHLPMILDDVFVNFDAGRTKIAAAVLREFAREGHQLIVFTCHEHVWRMFQEIKVDTRRLPSRFRDAAEELPAPDEPAAIVVEQVKPESKAAPPPAVPVVIEEPPAPVVAELIVPEPELVELPVDEEDEVEYVPPVRPPQRAQVEVEYWWPTAAARN